MIILEGPDGAGKTTLIRALAEKYTWPIAPRVVDQNTNPMVDLRQWVEDQLANDKYYPEILFDRHRLISEPIYSLAIGGDRDDKFWDLHWLRVSMGKFYNLQPFVIWCLPSYDTVERNCQVESNRFVQPFTKKIYRGYVAEMARWGGMYQPFQLTYDYNNHDLGAWLVEFDNLLTLWRDR